MSIKTIFIAAAFAGALPVVAIAEDGPVPVATYATSTQTAQTAQQANQHQAFMAIHRADAAQPTTSSVVDTYLPN